jgi:hypothetical protein
MQYSKALMVTVVLAFVLVLAATTASAIPQGTDLAGRWTGIFNRHGTPVTLVLSLKTSDGQVNGILADPAGNQMPIHEWKLKGTQLTFEVSAKEHGHARTDHFVGVVAEGVVTLLQHNGQKYDPPITFHRNKE